MVGIITPIALKKKNSITGKVETKYVYLPAEECEPEQVITIEDTISFIGQFVNGLHKGWYYDGYTTTDDGLIKILVRKV